jgi:predicted transcriptional regulator
VLNITVTPPERAPDVFELKARCKALRVTHDKIAKAAGVSRPMVVNVFAGRTTSKRIVKIAARLATKAEKRAERRGGETPATLLTT